jgi:hypothetical protein
VRPKAQATGSRAHRQQNAKSLGRFDRVRLWFFTHGQEFEQGAIFTKGDLLRID